MTGPRRALRIGALVSLLASVVVLADTRHPGTVRAFRALSGYPLGRPGMVVDHKIPLCAGGPDTVDNMAWEKVAESYVKDSFERALCLELERQGYYLVRVQK